MKKQFFLLGFYLVSCFVQAQQEHAWVYFKDKPDAPAFLIAPSLMLTQRAIARREKQNIEINTTDVPLCPDYVAGVANSSGIAIKARSKWMNAVHVLGVQNDINELLNLSYIDSIQFANKSLSVLKAPKIAQQEHIKFSSISEVPSFDYGNSENQVTMIGVEAFHELGFQGQGMQIAVMDSGFSGINTAAAFSHLLDNDTANGEVLGGYNYVDQSSEYYAPTGSTHGTQVVSTMGAVLEGNFVGTSPKASYYLFVTEDVSNETPLEESLWVQAAEKADSLGVDILNTSLGYNQFDESKYNYTYQNMDGETTFISRGASLAAQKGMVVVTSAGNFGSSAWKYITAPADAKLTVAVGAVNSDESTAFFSSNGPTVDNRVKPETLSQGGNVYVVNENNEVKTTNGTSFSSPIVAGATACLWQAYPQKTSLEIREMLIANSQEFQNPTGTRGNGLLNLGNLGVSLGVMLAEETPVRFELLKNSKIRFFNLKKTPVEVQVFAVTGALVVQQKITEENAIIDIENLSEGIYFVRLNFKKTSTQFQIVKGR